MFAGMVAGGAVMWYSCPPSARARSGQADAGTVPARTASSNALRASSEVAARSATMGHAATEVGPLLFRASSIKAGTPAPSGRLPRAMAAYEFHLSPAV